MEIYLPIAEQSMNVFVLFGLGGAAGLLAGMFGVGGGFLATPLLIFVGIPPAVAVASQANQVIANSVSSLQVQWRRGNVDLRMGLVLLLGGMIGSSAGVWLFTWLKRDRPDRFRDRRDVRDHAVVNRPADAVRERAHL